MIPTDAARRRPVSRVLVGVVCAGIVVLVAGTFLPWLVSGRVNRSSYAATGALRALLDPGGAVGMALRIWPFASLVGAIAIALMVLGRPGLGGGLALLVAFVAGGVAAAALSTNSRGPVHVATSGPIVTVVGSALTLLGGIAYFVHLFFAARRLA